MWREVLRVINEGTVEGLAQAKTPPTHQQSFYAALRHSNEVFAAFKVHTMGNEMAAKLLDSQGHLKPFNQWLQEVSSISSHQVGSWLQTEYDTAVLRAHAAADWQEFERNKDVMPNLRWMPTTSMEPETSHSEYWRRKLTLSVDDPFWEEHHPGDRWNCKCSLEATDDPVVRLDDDTKPAKPQRGLENNPGKDGHTFSDNHPYFPDKCKQCAFHKAATIKNKLQRLFENRTKDCYNCPYIDGCISRMEEKKTIKEKAFARKQEVKENELMPKMDKQPCTAVVTGSLNRTNKVRDALLKHCHHDYDVDAAVYIWNNPAEMKFVRTSPLGEGKDMTLQRNIDNIKKKKEKLHFVEFKQYDFDYKGRTFEVKLALCKKGYEQFYSLYEK
jgi:hypothetical protein